ncbi:hypothetical protein PIB30_079059 [Stylosanthes scabra]|uniref:Putative plant transposon protein domain-containing protein n=1 Tax=Stylosanthes scabra TaxID=79078 RepID=A0ABU6WPA7_9FABA|nr:hypothetical protein [Stylosanthes scabra]
MNGFKKVMNMVLECMNIQRTSKKAWASGIGWRLGHGFGVLGASPRNKVSKWMIQEFYANAVQSEEEMGQADQHPYKSYVRVVEVYFSPENIKRVLRFKDNTPGAATDYTTPLNSDQRLDEVLQDLCIPGATWRLSSGQPAQPIQLRRVELTPLAHGWHEFIIHSIIPTGKKSKITIARAILIHSIIRGEDMRVEELIVDNIAVIAQGMQGKGKLAFPSIIFKLCKDAEVPMREFKRSELIPQDKLITARLTETTRFGRNVQVQQYNEEEEEEQPMPQFKGGNEEDHNQGQYQHFQHQYHQQEAGFQQHYMEHTQAQYLEELKAIKTRQDELWNNTNKFHHQIRKEQDMLAKEIQEVKKFQVNQTLMGNQKGSMEKLEQTMVLQQKEMKRQLKDWTLNVSSRDAYYYWAHQQANPNLTEIPIHQIPDLMHLNAEKGRHLFYGGLKSHLVAGSSSQAVPSQAPPPNPADEPMANPKD